MPRKRHTTPHSRVARDRIFNLQQDYRRIRTRQQSLVSQLDALISRYSNGTYSQTEYNRLYSILIQKIQTANRLMEHIDHLLRNGS